jgi:putative PIN family toxin of toxin-antitoxin system
VRIAFDTNVLVSAVATRGLCADLFNLVLAEHQLIIGITVLGELKKVLRQKIRVPADIIDEFGTLLRREATVVGKSKALAIEIRDKSDAAVLAEAVAGGAKVLVTGDEDLLAVADRAPIEILSPRGFWEQLRKLGSG